jgi:hypothetical protein
MPQGYFDEESEKALSRFTDRACRGPRAELAADYPDDLRVKPQLAANWRAPAAAVLRNWLAFVAERKS